MQILTVNLAHRSYPIYIGSGLIHDQNLLQQHIIGSQMMVVSQENVAKHYLEIVKNAFKKLHCDTMIILDGETSKSIATWQQILDHLLQQHHHRNTTLVALGGGVVGDVTGFAAATYQRGINFIQIPTTLLAQVDASVGGKTAVNHPLGKNMIGAFYQPKAVIIDVDTLITLPEREFRAGMTEIVKAGLLADISFFNWLEKNLSNLFAKDKDILIEAIKKAVQIKSSIVEEDETEKTGSRALLNLGHTFAHAIESSTHYKTYLHGEAVAIGICIAAALSERRSWLSKEEVKRIHQFFMAAKLPTALPATITNDQLVTAMLFDKKINQKGLVFILLSKLGHAQVVEDVSEMELDELLTDFRKKL